MMERYMMERPTCTKEIIIGHILIIVSSISYSIAWYILYKPLQNIPEAVADTMMTAALFLGITGAGLIIYGISRNPVPKDKKIKFRYILIACLILYIISYLITKLIFGRIFTSEILLLFIWLSMEACCIMALYYGNVLSLIRMLICNLLVLISIGIGMICYTIHYTLPEQGRFINGLIPYGVIASMMLVLIIFVLISKLFVKKTDTDVLQE
jgi:hypothetical protein